MRFKARKSLVVSPSRGPFGHNALAGSVASQAESRWQIAMCTMGTEHLSAVEPRDRPSNAAQANPSSLASDRKGTWEKQSLLYLKNGDCTHNPRNSMCVF